MQPDIRPVMPEKPVLRCVDLSSAVLPGKICRVGCCAWKMPCRRTTIILKRASTREPKRLGKRRGVGRKLRTGRPRLVDHVPTFCGALYEPRDLAQRHGIEDEHCAPGGALTPPRCKGIGCPRNHRLE